MSLTQVINCSDWYIVCNWLFGSFNYIVKWHGRASSHKKRHGRLWTARQRTRPWQITARPKTQLSNFARPNDGWTGLWVRLCSKPWLTWVAALKIHLGNLGHEKWQLKKRVSSYFTGCESVKYLGNWNSQCCSHIWFTKFNEVILHFAEQDECKHNRDMREYKDGARVCPAG